jgi:hypothetical protein
MKTNEDEKNSENGIKRKIILFGKRIEKIVKSGMKKEKKHIKCGRKNQNLSFRK